MRSIYFVKVRFHRISSKSDMFFQHLDTRIRSDEAKAGVPDEGIPGDGVIIDGS